MGNFQEVVDEVGYLGRLSWAELAWEIVQTAVPIALWAW